MMLAFVNFSKHWFTKCSSSGDLYEFEKSSKPPWKKHIWSKESKQDAALTPSTSCAVHRKTGPHSDSLFLLTKVLDNNKNLPFLKISLFYD